MLAGVDQVRDPALEPGRGQLSELVAAGRAELVGAALGGGDGRRAVVQAVHRAGTQAHQRVVVQAVPALGVQHLRAGQQRTEHLLLDRQQARDAGELEMLGVLPHMLLRGVLPGCAGVLPAGHRAIWIFTSVGRPSRNRSKAATESSKAKVSETKGERSTASLAARSIAFWCTFA